MQLYPNANLKPYHTFGIEQSCKWLTVVESVEDLVELYRRPDLKDEPKVILGKGSNLLFTDYYQGVVVVNRLLGMTHTQDEYFNFLHVAGGEDWPQLVQWCTEHQLVGLENLALIPGCAGSAPIQNIGAYGLEFKDVCQYVDYFCLDSFTVKRLSAAECQFGYRDSIFKHALYNKAIVIAVGLKLAKQWQPILSYGPLQSLPKTASAQDIYHTVCKIREEKLPNPAINGNAGSFFKNPVISQASFKQLQQRFPSVVAYPTQSGVKVAAGWLIDQAGLKGVQLGGAQVHPKQALVIVNIAKATAQDVIKLAAQVRHAVSEMFGVELEHEVRFMGATGETNLSQLLGNENERAQR